MDLSVIIPYYNSGNFIDEALESVEKYTGDYTVEIIIINDGSKEENSLKVLERLKKSGKYLILNQENKGAAVARNTGIAESKGEFILFLDSDNKINPEYIEKGIDSLRKNTGAAVYYSDRETFGDIERNIPATEAFDIDKMIMRNYVDMCAVVRKSALLEANSFTIHQELSSCEDWELWLKIYKKGWTFIFNPEKLFYYRIRSGSISDVEDVNFLRSRNYITKTHSDILRECYLKKYFLAESLEKQREIASKNPLRSFAKAMVSKYFRRN